MLSLFARGAQSGFDDIEMSRRDVNVDADAMRRWFTAESSPGLV
jgi:hypothetical protein